MFSNTPKAYFIYANYTHIKHELFSTKDFSYKFPTRKEMFK